MGQHRLYPWLLGTICTLLVSPAFSQEDNTIFNLLYHNGVREIELHMNIDSMLLNRTSDRRVPGKVIFAMPGGERTEWQVEVNVRGRYRRMICEFPPLKINFKKQVLKERGMLTHNSLKLVTHCLEGDQGEDRLLREYLVYRMYRELTDASIRPLLVRVSYFDQKGKKRMQRYGVLLEDEEELAQRLGCELCEDCYNQPEGKFNREQISRLGLFQYMIANIDWSPKTLRNLLLLKPKEGGTYLLVPYDFDFTGVVDPAYARVPKSLGINSIRQRLYMGFPYPPEDYNQAFSYLQSKKEAMMGDVSECGEISGLSRRDIRAFLDSFYKSMEKDGPDYRELLANTRSN